MLGGNMDNLVGGSRKKRLGDLLVDAGVITQDQLMQALQIQKTEKKGYRLGVVLIDLGMTDEKQIMDALKMQLKIESIDLSTIRIPEEIIRLVEESVLRKYMLIPFQFNEKNPNLLKVAMSDPLDIRAMDDISIITGCQVERYVATPSDIAAAIDRYYGNAEALRRRFSEISSPLTILIRAIKAACRPISCRIASCSTPSTRNRMRT